ncbi:hypothetical protein [Sphingomonas sp. Leaf38]|nr:hypothetical protein [Sphingomonas sp. Leaf38]
MHAPPGYDLVVGAATITTAGLTGWHAQVVHVGSNAGDPGLLLSTGGVSIRAL